MITIADLEGGVRQRKRVRAVYLAEKQAGECISRGGQARRIGCLRTNEVIEPVGAGKVVAERAQAPYIPAHLELMLAANPIQLLTGVGCPVRLDAFCHLPLKHAPDS